MRSRRGIALTRTAIALAFVLVLAPAQAFAGTYVLDEANVIPADIEARIEKLSAEIESATPGAEIAVVTVTSLGGITIEEYAEERFDQLGVGAKDKDNGVLLLVAMTERQMRIEVGYGLEGALPDSKAGSIIDSIMTPKFKAGDIAGGIEAGHAAIAGVVAEEYEAYVPGAEAPSGGSWLLVLLVLGGVIVMIGAFIYYLNRYVKKSGVPRVPGAPVPPVSTTNAWHDSDDDSHRSSSSSSGSSFGGGGFGGGGSGGGGASGGW